MRMVPLICSLVLGSMLSCNNGSMFSGNTRTKNQRTPPATHTSNDSPSGGIDKILWFLPCDQTEESPSSGDSTTLILKGPGPHKVKQSSVSSNLELQISGRLCPPKGKYAETVILVDGSGSMRKGDPVGAEGSCGRLTAIEKIVKAGNPAVDRYAVAVFDEEYVEIESSRFFASSKDLLADLGKFGSAAETICKGAGASEFDSGLSAARNLLQKGKVNSNKNIILISDGEARSMGSDLATNMIDDKISGAFSKDVDGQVLASSLKKDGLKVQEVQHEVKIGVLRTTVPQETEGHYLGTVDDLASKDQEGNPLADDLARAESLAGKMSLKTPNDFKEGRIWYKSPDGANEFDAKQMFTDESLGFRLPAAAIEASGQIEASAEYMDIRGDQYRMSGTIVFE